MRFQILPSYHTINSDVYCQQLMELEKTIKEKSPELQIVKLTCFMTVYMFSNTYKISGTWLWSNVALSIYHRPLIIIYFEVYKTVKISTMITSNCTGLRFLLIKNNSLMSAESWSYQKDEKRSSNRTENIWLITVNFLCKKSWDLVHIKKPKLLSCNPID